MTDDNVKPASIEKVIETPEKPSSKTNDPQVVVQKVVEKKGGKGLGIFAILLSLVAIGGSGFNWYNANIQGKLDEASLAVDVAKIGGQISRIGDTVSNIKTQQDNVVSQEQLTTRFLEASNTIDSRFRDLKQSQQAVSESVEKLNADLSRDINQFVVGEVSQLLKLANNTVLFSGNIESAIKALKLADSQLKELADPRYSIVRKKINEEIALLDSLDQVDIESVSVRLKTLSDRIPSLKLENDTPTLGEADIALEVEEQATGIKATFKKAVNDLIGLVKIQKIDKAPKALLAPEQRYFLDQNIQLQLAKADLALVQNHSAIFADSLTAATQMLNDYFDTRTTAVQEVQSSINELQAITIGKDLPSISGSYTVLQSIKGGQ
jgi:uroporphyrin-3 C-methyltransferase